MMRGDLFFDGRNNFDPDLVAQAGFRYVGIGRGGATTPPRVIAHRMRATRAPTEVARAAHSMNLASACRTPSRERDRPWPSHRTETDASRAGPGCGARRRAPPGVDLSVVIPLYNEEESIDPAVEEVLGVLTTLPLSFELILVNDGSTDSTGAKALAWHEFDARVKVIEFRRNFGQTAGISAGFDYAAGRVVVVMDGDQQNDPADIPSPAGRARRGLRRGFGLEGRPQGQAISAGACPPWWPTRSSPGSPAWRCTTTAARSKAYDKEVIEHLELFGELHRFIPALALISGAKVIEIPVNHRAREHGSSKYGISRMPRVVLDLLTVKFLIGYRQKPMQFFGRAGAGLHRSPPRCRPCGPLSRLLRGRPLRSGVSTIFGLAALQFASFGLIGELLTRVYFKDSAHRPTWCAAPRRTPTCCTTRSRRSSPRSTPATAGAQAPRSRR